MTDKELVLEVLDKIAREHGSKDWASFERWLKTAHCMKADNTIDASILNKNFIYIKETKHAVELGVQKGQEQAQKDLPVLLVKFSRWKGSFLASNHKWQGTHEDLVKEFLKQRECEEK